MTDVEHLITDHLRRKAAAATPRYDPEAIEQGGALPLVDLEDRRQERPLVRAIVGVAAAVVLLVAIALVRDTSDRNDAPPAARPGKVPADQLAAIGTMVDAVNARATDAFLDAFSPRGAFAPRGHFTESPSLSSGSTPVADVDTVQAFLLTMDAWGLEAEILACSSEDVPAGNMMDGVDAVVECEVRTRWHALSMEIIESWYFELEDAELLWWNSVSCCRNFDLLDLDPPDRDLPLDYDGLEAWEAWLQANHPGKAARWLNPRENSISDCDGCAEARASLAPGDPDRADRLAPLVSLARDDWVVDGHRFRPNGLIPYDPAFADEIGASIRDYLGDDRNPNALTVILPVSAAVVGAAALVAWRRRRSPSSR